MGFFMGCFGPTTKNKPGSRVENEDRVGPETTLVKKYKWEEIEKYTMNFEKVIGVGGYSRVYLAKFPNLTLGAIKVYYHSGGRLNQVFKNELEICQKLNHPNIVKLLGFCDDKDEGVLVFEYLPKGNLQELLHNEDQNNAKKHLTWKQRMKIAYQVAKSLEYLHESCDLQIVHGDIKSSNILLDENLDCTLCDFGFAKMGFSSMVKPSSSRVSMMGSPGYIDPHLLMTGIASKKSDVYGFGVVLLELITGLEAFICRGENEVLLTSIVRNKRGFDFKKLVELIDPKIVRHEVVDMEEVKVIAEIAACCLHHLPSLRHSPSQICQLLHEKISCISDFSLCLKNDNILQ